MNDQYKNYVINATTRNLNELYNSNRINPETIRRIQLSNNLSKAIFDKLVHSTIANRVPPDAMSINNPRYFNMVVSIINACDNNTMNGGYSASIDRQITDSYVPSNSYDYSNTPQSSLDYNSNNLQSMSTGGLSLGPIVEENTNTMQPFVNPEQLTVQNTEPEHGSRLDYSENPVKVLDPANDFDRLSAYLSPDFYSLILNDKIEFIKKERKDNVSEGSDVRKKLLRGFKKLGNRNVEFYNILTEVLGNKFAKENNSIFTNILNKRLSEIKKNVRIRSFDHEIGVYGRKFSMMSLIDDGTITSKDIEHLVKIGDDLVIEEVKENGEEAPNYKLDYNILTIEITNDLNGLLVDGTIVIQPHDYIGKTVLLDGQFYTEINEFKMYKNYYQMVLKHKEQKNTIIKIDKDDGDCVLYLKI